MSDQLKRIEQILTDKKFQDHMEHIRLLEQDRLFCRHDMNHLLDVCRISWILNLEEDHSVEKEVLYAAGLLHDIGRWKQYIDGEDHAKVSSELAADILNRCGFTSEESSPIRDAIAAHRTGDQQGGQNEPLTQLLYRADKLSRPCITCKAISECKNFSNDEKAKFRY